jgi:hypothetical protein
MLTTERTLRGPRLPIAVWSVIAVLIAAWPTTARAGDFRLLLQFDGPYSTCRPISSLPETRTAGSMCALTVSTRPASYQQSDPPYHGITDWAWPSDLTIEVGTTSQGSMFEPSPQSLAASHLQYYLPQVLVVSDSVWRATGYVTTSEHRFPQYNFVFHLPDHLAGQQLRFRVRFNRAEYGTLEATKDIEILAPCSDADTQALRDSYVYFADKARDYERAIHWADSLIALGWQSQFGLLYAYEAASSAQHYDTALRYLDLCYGAHGTVARHSVLMDSSSEREYYLIKRADVMEHLNRQQQQR